MLSRLHQSQEGKPTGPLRSRIETLVTFGGCPWGRARQRKYGVKPNEPLPPPSLLLSRQYILNGNTGNRLRIVNPTSRMILQFPPAEQGILRMIPMENGIP